MSDTYTEVKAIIKDLLGADEAKITPEARFREELENARSAPNAAKPDPAVAGVGGAAV